jgi:predicted nucleic acid-binding Zn ribbon protein
MNMASELVVERDVQRVFHLRCSCGTSLVATEKSIACANCGKTHEVRRVRQRGPSSIAVEYHFHCCFCGAAIVTPKKLATCTACGGSLRILRAEKQTQRRSKSPSYDPRQVFQQWCIGMAIVFLLLCFLFDWVSS